MKNEVTGVVGGIVTAMIHKEMFADLKTPQERRDEISRTVKELGKSFD